jgi:drug/metabolite transporter (DMT)-like permease
MARLLLAVITGYLAFAISAALFFQFTGHDPYATPSLLFGIASVIYGMVCAAMAGFMAVRLAQRANLVAAVLVGVMIAAVAVVSIILERRHGQIWSQLSALLLMAPSAYAGGLLYRREKARSQ